MFVLLLFILICFIQSCVAAHVVLHANEPNVRFSWSIIDNRVLEYAVEADVVGWIGIGFSSTGSMNNADDYND